VILYRKPGQLRIKRAPAPHPPFWCATSIAPYSARRAEPVAIDYVGLRAGGADRLEVTVADNVRDELERTRAIEGPVLIDAAEQAEAVFRRGEEALAFSAEQGLGTLFLTSTRGVLPRHATSVVVAAWPLELNRLEELFSGDFGVAVPLIYPTTTDLAALEDLADRAKRYGARFLTGVIVEVEQTAKQAIAQSMDLAHDDDRYAMLFHAEVEPIHLATERHIAALAHERGMADFVLPPRWEERSNWNAAVLLTLVASRMFAMELDLDLAGVIARSARLIAELDKPVARVAEAASVSIIGGLDETSAQMLTEWLQSGTASFAEYVGEQWRLRRSTMNDER
jgi:hypothetical protein